MGCTWQPSSNRRSPCSRGSRNRVVMLLSFVTSVWFGTESSSLELEGFAKFASLLRGDLISTVSFRT